MVEETEEQHGESIESCSVCKMPETTHDAKNAAGASKFSSQNGYVNGPDISNNGTLDAIAKHLDNLPIIESRTGQPSFKREVLLQINGEGLYDDALGNCTTLLVDFPHVFQNFQPSETLAILLAKPDLMLVVNQYGGPIPLLQKIVSEMKIRCKFSSPAQPLKTGEICYFLRFRFPFDFKYKILNCAMVNGVGPSKSLAKSNAAIEGLALLRNLFLKEKFHSYNLY